MVYKRNAKRKFRPRRKRMYKKTSSNRMSKIIIPPSMRNQKIHKFKRFALQTVFLTPDNAGNSIVNYQTVFNLASVSNYGEFTALFDQYRIVAVAVYITPSGQFITNDRTVTGAGALPGADQSGTGYWRPPMLYAVIDYNDNNALPSIASAEEYSSLKLIPYDKKFTKFYFTPCINIDVAQDAGTTARTGTKFAPWLSCANSNIQHYGLKFLVYNPNGNNVVSAYATCSYIMRIKYYLEFKNVV